MREGESGFGAQGMTPQAGADRKGALNFLRGGGELGAIIRAHDWASSPLGPPEAWPQALKTAVRLLLSTGHPMFLWWGPELIQFYNDAYRQSIGPERHPGAVGQRGRDCWEEIWPIIGPQIEQVMAGGEPTWHENALVPITRNGRLEDVYWTYSYGPVDDESAPNGVGGVLVVCTETTETVLAERRRAETVSRWRRLFDQAPSFMAILGGPEHVVEFVNDAHMKLFGSRDWIDRPVRAAFPDVAGQGFFEALDHVYATGERVVFEDTPVRYRLTPEAPEAVRHMHFIYAPIVDAEARVIGIFWEGIDLTDAHRMQAALRDSEEQLRLATEAAEVGFWDLDVGSDVLFWPPRVKAMFGVAADADITMATFYDALHPADRDATRAAFEAALDPERRERYDVEFRTIGRDDGAVRWVAGKGRAIFDDAGRPTRVLGTALDITERKSAEARLRLMINELNHRVKNSLATVQAIAAQTLHGHDVPERVRNALTERLIALSRAHDVLTDRKWAGASLAEIARQAAAPHLSSDRDRFVIEGPHVDLPPRSAIAVALALHELATNAAKYGALSVPEGRVRIDWSTAPGEGDDFRLKVTWRESGGPPVAPPASRGFGTRLIERGLAAELRGEVRIDYQPDGVVCTVDAVVSATSETDWGAQADLSF